MLVEAEQKEVHIYEKICMKKTNPHQVFCFGKPHVLNVKLNVKRCKIELIVLLSNFYYSFEMRKRNLTHSPPIKKKEKEKQNSPLDKPQFRKYSSKD